jgi:hypothetical protein
MDTIVMIMVGSVVCVTTALTFMETRRIRKMMSHKTGTSPPSST